MKLFNRKLRSLSMPCLAAAVLLAAGAASGQGFTVIGEVRGPSGFWSDLTLEVEAVAGGGAVTRTYIRPDGTFNLHNLAAGTFRVSLRDSRGDTVWQDLVSIAPGTTPLVIDLHRTAPEPVYRGTISVASLRQKRFPAALRELRLAEKSSAKGQSQESLDHLRKAVTAAPEMQAARNNLGATLLRNGAFDEARIELQAAVAIDRETPIPHANLALALLALDHTSEALTEAFLALRRDPLQAGANYAAGAALHRQGHSAEALLFLQRAESEAPQALLVEARIFEAQSKKAEAVDKLRTYLSRKGIADRSEVTGWLAKLTAASF